MLHFLDIGQSQVFHYDTVTTKLTVDQFDEPVTALALRSNGEGVSASLYNPERQTALQSRLGSAHPPRPPMNL
jgi:hypothetical protein